LISSLVFPVWCDVLVELNNLLLEKDNVRVTDLCHILLVKKLCRTQNHIINVIILLEERGFIIKRVVGRQRFLSLNKKYVKQIECLTFFRSVL
jgi:hypothetical protein